MPVTPHWKVLSTGAGGCQVLPTVPLAPSAGPAWLVDGIQYVFLK